MGRGVEGCLLLPEFRTTLVKGDLPAQWEKVTELISDAGFSLQVADVERLGEANGITDWRKRDVVAPAGLPGGSGSRPRFTSLPISICTSQTRRAVPNVGGSSRWKPNAASHRFCLPTLMTHRGEPARTLEVARGEGPRGLQSVDSSACVEIPSLVLPTRMQWVAPGNM